MSNQEIDLNFNLDTGIAEKTAESLGDFCNIVDGYTIAWRNRITNRIKKNEIESFPGELSPWFRGLSNESYPCEPGILRESNYKYFPDNFKDLTERGKKEFINRAENYLLQRFKNYGSYLINRQPEHQIQWLFLMQHHSLLTRLLDWSKSSLTALFFAVKKYDEKKDEFTRNDRDLKELPPAVVWMIEPRKLSEMCHASRGIYGANKQEHLDFIDQTYLNLSNITDGRLPLPLIPDFISPRITSQVGRFTLHSHLKGGIKDFALKSLEKNPDPLNYVARILIPYHCHVHILRSLRVAGMSQVNIKQDLDGVSEELLWRMRLGKDDRYPVK
ncbi:MAG: FRG domain-containing protein [Spirulinaceae cyanobacterium]